MGKRQRTSDPLTKEGKILENNSWQEESHELELQFFSSLLQIEVAKNITRSKSKILRPSILNLQLEKSPQLSVLQGERKPDREV